MADETYYSILEISETASAAEIKAAYLSLIREVHPDRLANAPAYWQRQAEEKSKEINEAYAVLSKREKRHLYDAQLVAYRASRSTTSGQATSQPPTPPPASSTQQRSQASARPQASSGASAGSAQTPYSASQRRQAASTSAPPANVPTQSTGRSFSSGLNAGQRLFLALLCGLYAIGAGYAFLIETTTEGQFFLFFLSVLCFFLCVLIYQERIRSIFVAMGLSRIRHHVLISVGVIVLALFAGKIANMNRDTHFRGPDDHSASNEQMSQVKIINGSLSDTKVSGRSNEKYLPAYSFTGYIQNNSTAMVSFLRMKIRIFDCPSTGSPSSYTSYGVTYHSGIFDPSPPTSCKEIGEAEEDDFPHAEPGQTLWFTNFYFPNHPQGGLRWNYEIAQMDTQSVAVSVPAQRTSDALQIELKSEPPKIMQSQPLSQTAQQPSTRDKTQGPVPAAAPISASSLTYGKPVQHEADGPWRKSLTGSWVGKYNCAQGVTGLTLGISESADGGLSAIFDFYPVPGGNRFPEGSYSGAVTAGPDGSFEFKPGGWISQPPGFVAVALSGHYLGDAQRLQGTVTGVIGCTTFDLSRQRSEVRPPSVTYDLSSLSASDRDSIESACSGARLVQGAGSYHRCLSTQLEEFARSPDTPDLSRLSSVDRDSITSACSGARLVQGAASYHRCLHKQLEELARFPNTPDLSGLSSVDRSSIESACSGARLVQGPGAYHRCLRSQLSDLGGR